MDYFHVIESKAGSGTCVVRFCRRAAQAPNHFCRRCRDRRYKATRPHAYALNKLRNNARRRGKEFTITLEQWVDWCTEHGFLEKTGKSADALTVDRKDHTQGYHIWNIQPLTNSANGTKGNHERQYSPSPDEAPDDGDPF